MNGKYLNAAATDPNKSHFSSARIKKVVDSDRMPIATKKTDEIVGMIKLIAAALVDDPQAIEFSTVNGNSILIIELKVAKADLGKMIGRNGRTADAIRHLLAAACTRCSMKVLLELIE